MSHSNQTLPIVRLKLALLAIRSDRAMGRIETNDAENFRIHGFASERAFWELALSEPMSAVDFVDMLAGFLSPWKESTGITDDGEEKLILVPNRDASGRDFKADSMRRDILKAFDAREPWVFLSGREQVCRGIVSLYVRPREAAEWLAKPLRQHLLPPGLIAHLDKTDLNCIEAGAIESKRRGPIPAKTSAVMDAMRSHDSTELLRMKDTVLHCTFKGAANASQSTCRKARDLLVEERAQSN